MFLPARAAGSIRPRASKLTGNLLGHVLVEPGQDPRAQVDLSLGAHDVVTLLRIDDGLRRDAVLDEGAMKFERLASGRAAIVHAADIECRRLRIGGEEHRTAREVAALRIIQAVSQEYPGVVRNVAG